MSTSIFTELRIRGLSFYNMYHCVCWRRGLSSSWEICKQNGLDSHKVLIDFSRLSSFPRSTLFKSSPQSSSGRSVVLGLVHWIVDGFSPVFLRSLSSCSRDSVVTLKALVSLLLLLLHWRTVLVNISLFTPSARSYTHLIFSLFFCVCVLRRLLLPPDTVWLTLIIITWAVFHLMVFPLSLVLHHLSPSYIMFTPGCRAPGVHLITCVLLHPTFILPSFIFSPSFFFSFLIMFGVRFSVSCFSFFLC